MESLILKIFYPIISFEIYWLIYVLPAILICWITIVYKINQLDNSSPFNIFPNPAAHEINMSGFDSSHDSLIGIYDLNQNSMQVNFE